MTFRRNILQRTGAALLVWALVLALLPAATVAAEEDAPFAGYFVKVAEEPAPAMSILSAGRSLLRALPADPSSIEGVTVLEDGLYLVDSLEAAERLAELVEIEYVEPNYLMSIPDEVELMADSETADPGNNSRHWSLIKANSHLPDGITGTDRDLAHNMGSGSENGIDPIVVAVIDSGLVEGHPDIDYDRVIWPGRHFIWVNSGYGTPYYQYEGGSEKGDDKGHGTYVVGQILASTENGIGIDGLSPQVYVMPLRVLDQDTESSFNYACVIKALEYATEQKKAYLAGEDGVNICVANISAGGIGRSSTLKKAVDDAIAAGIIVVCAAGNNGDTTRVYPAQYAIGVGYTLASGTAGTKSQVLSTDNGDGYRNKVWVTAPGYDYTSTYNANNYHTGGGTSYAAPQVSALAALAVSVNNDLASCFEKGEQVRQGGVEVEINGTKTLTDDYVTIRGDGEYVPYVNNHWAFKKLLQDTATRKASGADNSIGGQDTKYGYGIVDYEKLLGKLTGDAVEVTAAFRDDLEADIPAEDLTVEVYPSEGDGTVAEGAEPLTVQNGVYTATRDGWYTWTMLGENHVVTTETVQLRKYWTELTFTLPRRSYDVDFAVADAENDEVVDDVTVRIFDASEAEVEQVDGKYQLIKGDYTYVVAGPGYEVAEDSFTVTGETTVPVILYPIPTTTKDILFEITGEGAENITYTIWDSEEHQLFPTAEDGKWLLGPGDYTCRAVADNYREVAQPFTVTGGAGVDGDYGDLGTELTVPVALAVRLWPVTLDLTPAVAQVTVTAERGEAPETPDENGVYHLEDGIYEYTAEAEGYVPVSGSFTVAGESPSVPVVLTAVPVKDPTPTPSSTPSSPRTPTPSPAPSPVVEPEEKQEEPDEQPPSEADADEERMYLLSAEEEAQRQTELAVETYGDVAETAWYAQAVGYVTEKGLFGGTEEGEFSPDVPMTRAMLVTVLYRLEGEPEVTDIGVFTDVGSNKYYTKAVAWAAENGIVSGMGKGIFNPHGPALRQQMAVILYQYAKYKGYNVEGTGDLSRYSDGDEIASWAETALEWANGAGIMTGRKATLLAPEGYSTRAETAAMLMRFCEGLAEEE